jgi:hypothetical protein
MLNKKVKWWMGWSNFFDKNKTEVPLGVEKRRKENLDKGSLTNIVFVSNGLSW